MSFRDRELAHADQAVHFAGVFLAEQRTGLTQAHRQVTIGTSAVQEHLILERAGHGTQGEAFLRLVIRIAQDEHAVKVMIPVTGDLVQLTLGQERRLGQQIAPLFLRVFNPALEQLDDAGALGQQDRQALADIIDRGEILELAAKLVMVALERFFLLLQVLFHFILVIESGTVNALQHLVLFASAPVGTGDRGQLKGLYFAGGSQMRASAQVHEIALAIEGNDGVFGQIIDQLDLIGLFPALHEGNGFITRKLETLYAVVLLDNAGHFLFNFAKEIIREGLIGIEIIVEAVIDGGADRELDLGPELLDCLCQNVRGGMTQDALCFIVREGQELDLMLTFKRTPHFGDGAVNARTERIFLKRLTDLPSNLQQ